MKRLALLAFFLVAACGPISTAQAHSISLGYRAGDTYKYDLHMAMKYTVGAGGMSIPINLDLSAKETVTVKSVDSSGTADLTVDVSGMSMKMSMNGTTNTTTTTTTSTVEMKIASDGHIVSINGNALGSNSFPGASGSQGGLVSAILPSTPVKPGDTWTKTFEEPSPFGAGSVQVTSDSKYLRDEKVGNASTAVVESKINGNLNLTIDAASMGGSLLPGTGGAGGVQSISLTGTSASDVTSWIDTSARRIAKTHSAGSLDGTMTINMPAGATTPGFSGPITFKGTQTLDLTPA